MSSKKNNQYDHLIKFDIVKNRRKMYLLSTIILVLGLLHTLIFGMNLGVDFKSGTRLDIFIGKEFNTTDVDTVIKQQVPDVAFKAISKLGTNHDTATTTFDQPVDAQRLSKIEEVLKAKYGAQVNKQESTVSPVIAEELVEKAAIAVVLAAIGIIIYIAIRFQFYFGLACVVALLHDVLIPIALFSIFEIEVDLTFIAAILTIVGYSINDTVVIFDRIRENLRLMKVRNVEELEHMVNVSLWQTMRRSIYTVATVFFCALAVAVLGGEGIRNFSICLLFGLVSGTYSSIFVAAQVWVTLKKREMAKKRMVPSPNEA